MTVGGNELSRELKGEKGVPQAVSTDTTVDHRQCSVLCGPR